MTTATISQEAVEVLQYAVPSTASISQEAIEVLQRGVPSSSQISQFVIEVLAPITTPIVVASRGYKLLPTIN